MELQASKLFGHTIAATDGDIGTVEDIYFDDEWWAVRYFVVDTGEWLGGRQVLISTESLRPGGWPEKTIPVNLTRQQVETSPPVDTDRPVSRHYEASHAVHFHNRYYWNGPHGWAAGPWGMMLGTEQPRPGAEGRQLDEISAAEHEQAERSHLRSATEVIGYDVVSTDGEAVGKIDDLIVDSDNWRITHLIADTRTWLPGGQVRLPPEAVEHFNWSLSAVRLNLTRDQVKKSPHFR